MLGRVTRKYRNGNARHSTQPGLPAWAHTVQSA